MYVLTKDTEDMKNVVFHKFEKKPSAENIKQAALVAGVEDYMLWGPM